LIVDKLSYEACRRPYFQQIYCLGAYWERVGTITQSEGAKKRMVKEVGLLGEVKDTRGKSSPVVS